MSPRESLASWRSRQKATETGVDAAVAEVKAERDAEWAEARQAAQQAAAERKTYTHDDPAELRSPEGPYSADVNRYVPMCVPCHKRFDLARLK